MGSVAPGKNAAQYINYQVAFTDIPVVVTCYRTNETATEKLLSQCIVAPQSEAVNRFRARVSNNTNAGGTGVDVPLNGCS